MEDIIHVKGFIPKTAADAAFDTLLKEVEWHNVLNNDEGVPVKINRKMAYMYDEPVNYRYARLNLPGTTWNTTAAAIKQYMIANIPFLSKDEKLFEFNSVLLNLYETGKDEIRWHSDKETQLGEKPVIACINLGAGRKFSFMKKGKTPAEREIVEFFVEHGDLLMMMEDCQDNWLHAILRDKSVTEPRISLTFRLVHKNV